MKSIQSAIYCTSLPFKAYSSKIEEIPQNYHHGYILQSRRNLIIKSKIFQQDCEPLEIVVKAFSKPGKIKGFMYANYFPTKAKRSYLNALHLIEVGIPTPEPIAYIEMFNYNCIRESFYVCRFWEHNIDLTSYLYRGISSDIDTQTLLESLAKFTANLHNKGILNLDYNPSNILVKFKDNRFYFALVDLNRVKFTEMGLTERVKGLVRLTLKPEIMKTIGGLYAKHIGIDHTKFCTMLHKEHSRFWKKKSTFVKIKRFCKFYESTIT